MKMSDLDMCCGNCSIIDFCNDYADTPPCSQPRFEDVEVADFLELAKTSRCGYKNAIIDDVYMKLQRERVSKL